MRERRAAFFEDDSRTDAHFWSGSGRTTGSNRYARTTRCRRVVLAVQSSHSARGERALPVQQAKAHPAESVIPTPMGWRLRV